MKIIHNIVFLVLAVLLWNCSSIVTNTDFYRPVILNLKQGDFLDASKYIETAEVERSYSFKDRVLLYLDKGIVLHYSGEYEKSNEAFHRAEFLIDSLYTKSISMAVTSVLLNDNALAYSGEVYENLYINIFKVLNYIHLDMFEDAYVEVQRISDKLKEQNIYYKESIAELNKSEDSKIEIEHVDLDFYNDAFANYLSHLIYRAEGEEDNSRISLENANKAWNEYPSVYNYEMPLSLSETTSKRESSFLNIIAFTGNAPVKYPVGARITTFDDLITISDPSDFHITPIPFPGIENGWNFKFEFPEMHEEGTIVHEIKIYADGFHIGDLELLENISNVARKTFEVHKGMIFFKTAIRAITKGITAGLTGKEIKKGVKDETLGDVLAFILNIAVDATEQADLRTWRTIPGYSFIGEFSIEAGLHDIEIRFIGPDNEIIKTDYFKDFNVNDKLNILESFYLD